jgi:hypothetical protein
MITFLSYLLLSWGADPSINDRISTGSERELIAPSPETTSPASDSDGEKYLLLDTDRISAGKVTESGDDYIVERGGARIVVAKQRTKIVAQSLDEIYRYRSQRIPVNDIPMRADFAKWCFDQGLVDFAISEAELVLSLDPGNEIAKRVVKLCKPPEKSPTDRKVSTTAAIKRLRQPDPARVITQFKSAYGQDLFDQYKQMEPMLRVSCGNSACHGSRHEGPFRVYSRTNSTGTDIGLTARNLTSLLDSVDYSDPQRSPVLYKSLERHGSSSLPPLSGVQDPTYMQLQEWVHEIARRWSGNEIPVEAPTEDDLASKSEADNSFAEERRNLEPRTFVKRTSRPSRPVMSPGDGFEIVRPGLAADDAPAPKVEAMPDRSLESSPNSPTESDGEEWPAKNQRGFDPEKLSADEMSAPVPANAKPAAPQPGPVRRAMNRFMDIVGGRPQVKASIPIQKDAKGGVFEAAPPPISLQEDFIQNEPILDGSTSSP